MKAIGPRSPRISIYLPFILNSQATRYDSVLGETITRPAFDLYVTSFCCKQPGSKHNPNIIYIPYLSIVGRDDKDSVSTGVDCCRKQLLLLSDPNAGSLHHRHIKV